MLGNGEGSAGILERNLLAWESLTFNVVLPNKANWDFSLHSNNSDLKKKFENTKKKAYKMIDVWGLCILSLWFSYPSLFTLYCGHFLCCCMFFCSLSPVMHHVLLHCCGVTHFTSPLYLPSLLTFSCWSEKLPLAKCFLICPDFHPDS